MATTGRSRFADQLRPIPDKASQQPTATSVYIIRQSSQIVAVGPNATDPLVAQFSFSTDDPSDPCSSYSVNGYGVTNRELRTFAEGLVPTP